MLSQKEKMLKAKIYNNSVKLVGQGQIPMALHHIVMNTRFTERYIVQIIEWLKNAFEEYTRVKGYYHKHKDIHINANKTIERDYQIFLEGLQNGCKS